ncbi:hypothetical protein DRQ50_13580 [bacterium]|nr:MAG: hypothetical protein DRQ50_13580 [bacterium]
MRILLGTLMLILLAGCGGSKESADDPEATVDPLEGSSWQLLFVRKSAVPDGVTITAQFTEGRITGRAGCNRYFADYSFNEGVLEIGPVGTTKMMCPEEVMVWETEFVNSLESAVRYQFDGDRLLIIREDGEHLTFDPATPGT